MLSLVNLSLTTWEFVFKVNSKCSNGYSLFSFWQKAAKEIEVNFFYEDHYNFSIILHGVESVLDKYDLKKF